jgi:hypothetical protein
VKDRNGRDKGNPEMEWCENTKRIICRNRCDLKVTSCAIVFCLLKFVLETKT